MYLAPEQRVIICTLTLALLAAASGHAGAANTAKSPAAGKLTSGIARGGQSQQTQRVERVQ
eukprot:gene33572-37939_t